MKDPDPAERTPTPEELGQKRSIELARQDLNDIAVLRESAELARYFLRRLAQKQTEIDRRFHDDPPEKCDAVRREVLRCLWLEYEEIRGMMQNDENACRRLLGDGS